MDKTKQFLRSQFYYNGAYKGQSLEDGSCLSNEDFTLVYEVKNCPDEMLLTSLISGDTISSTGDDVVFQGLTVWSPRQARIEPTPAQAKGKRRRFSTKFTREEYNELALHAQAQGETVDDLVHRIVTEHLFKEVVIPLTAKQIERFRPLMEQRESYNRAARRLLLEKIEEEHQKREKPNGEAT